MKLNEEEEQIVDEILKGKRKNDIESYYAIFEKVEIAFQVDRNRFSPFFLDFINRPLRSRDRDGGLVIFMGSATTSYELFEFWLRSEIEELAIRINRSWRCYLNCNGRVLEKTCEEDKKSTVECCGALRKKCGV